MVGITVAIFSLAAMPSCARQSPPPSFSAAVGEQRASYQQLAHLALQQVGDSLTQLQGSITVLLQAPSAESLQRARQQWARARRDWNIAEAFGLVPATGFRPEASNDKLQFWASTRIDGWPLEPELLHRVIAENGEAKIYELSAENIEALNLSEGDGSYTLGFHAVEYLLWGDPRQASSVETIVASLAKTEEETFRRRSYLNLVMSQLLADHRYLHNIWNSGRGSYAQRLTKVSDSVATERALLGLLRLIEQEIVFRTIQVPMRTGSPQLAQSYFSQQTGRDVLGNFEGFEAVMSGRLNSYSGVGMLALIKAVDPNLGNRLNREMKLAGRAILGISESFDATIASSAGDNRRAITEALVTTLFTLRQSLEDAASAMRLNVADNAEPRR